MEDTVILSARSTAAASVLACFLILLTIVGLFSSAVLFHALRGAVATTSPGNGAKYRFWLQIVLKNIVMLVVCHLVNVITVTCAATTATSKTREWTPLSVPAICYITGYVHVTLLLVGLAFINTLHCYQFLAVVVSPLEHPKYRYTYMMWGVSWLLPAVLCAILPASTATDIRYSYNRMTCTFDRADQVNHDTSLLVVMATCLGFTCVFCGILTLKVQAALNEESRLAQAAKHISLFGNNVVKARKVSTASTGTQQGDFKALCIWTLVTVTIYIPHLAVVFVVAANKGGIAREAEEFAIVVLRCLPLTDAILMTQDMMIKSRVTNILRTLDFKLRFFHCRNFIRKRQKTTRVGPNNDVIQTQGDNKFNDKQTIIDNENNV